MHIHSFLTWPQCLLRALLVSMQYTVHNVGIIQALYFLGNEGVTYINWVSTITSFHDTKLIIVFMGYEIIAHFFTSNGSMQQFLILSRVPFFTNAFFMVVVVVINPTI